MKTFRGIFLLLYILIACLHVRAQQRGMSDAALVSHVEWSSNSNHILVALQAGGLYVVDPLTQTAVVDISPDLTGTIEDASLQPSGTFIATVDRDSTLNIWDMNSATLVRSITNIPIVWRVDWSPDGRFIFTSNANEMYVRNAAGDPLFAISYAAEDMPNVTFSPSGELLLLSFSAKIEVWDLTSQQMLVRYILPGLRQSVQWSADENTILAANINNTREGTLYNIIVIDSMTGERLRTYSGFSNQLTSARWSPDETQILALSVDGTAYIVDAATGNITQIFENDTPLLSADWSPYGGQIAIGAPASSGAIHSLSGNEQVPLHIIVPDPSIERLQSIAQACEAPLSFTEILTSPSAETDIETTLDERLATLPDNTISPACAADLRAVAQAIEMQER